jgi:hypothetical protein
MRTYLIPKKTQDGDYASLRAPVFAVYGGADRQFTSQAVDAFEVCVSELRKGRLSGTAEWDRQRPITNARDRKKKEA